MRAIVFATGHTSMQALAEHSPAPLLPLLDRPFLQHVVEHLVDHGVETFDFVLGEHPDQIENHFGEGKRWGCRIRYYLARDAARPYAALQAAPPDDQAVTIAHADTLPLLPESFGKSPGSVLLEDAANGWTGWARVPGNLLPRLAEALTRAQAEAALRAAGVPPAPVALALRITGYDAFLEANRVLLEGRFPIPLLTGRQEQERIWVSRNVSLHPAARLHPPVFIGENCRISEGAEVGPFAVLGRDSVLDRQSLVRNAVVLPASYIGEALDVADSIVSGDRLINVPLGAELTIGEDFLLGNIAGEKTPHAGRPAGRLAAFLLLLCLWPLLLATAVSLAIFRRGPVWHLREAVRLPARNHPDQWQTVSLPSFAKAQPRSCPGHFLLWFLPGLLAVLFGRVALAGVEPRSRRQVEALPPDWRALYLRAKAGLVTEAFVQHGADPTADDLYACEAFYAVSAGPRFDAALLARYASRVCGFGRRPARPAATGEKA